MIEENYISISMKEDRVVEELSSDHSLSDNIEKNSAFQLLGYILYALGLLLPIWVLPITSFPLATNKAYLIYFLILAGLIAWIAGNIKESKISIPRSAFVAALILIVAVWGLSTIFSKSTQASFWGFGHEAGTFVAISISSLAAFLALIFFQNNSRILKWGAMLFVSAALVYLFQILNFFGLTPFFSNIFNSPTTNLIGGWNTFGIFAGLILILSLSCIDILRIKRFRVFMHVMAALSLFFVFLINFSLLWWVIAGFLIVATAYSFSVKKGTVAFLNATFFALIILIIFIFAGKFFSGAPAAFGINFLEVRPSWESTSNIIKNSIEANPLLGSGPNTFLYDWMKWRPATINTTPFWNTRFSAGVGLIPSLFAETGFLGILSVIVLLGMLIFYAIKAIVSFEFSYEQDLLITVFLMSAYLWAANIFYAPDFIILFLAFLVSGIFVALTSRMMMTRKITLPIFKSSGSGFLSIIFVIFIFMASVWGIFSLSERYASEYYFAQGVNEFNRGGDIESAKMNISKALNITEQDRYYRALTEINLLMLRDLLNKTNISAEELRSEFESILTETVKNAQSAIKLNDIDPLNWMSLGRVYEAVLPFRISGAAEAAYAAYDKAIERNPMNPEAFLAKAQIAFATANYDEARLLLNKATELKSDYAQARFLLAQIAVQQGDLKEAVRYSEDAYLLAPDDLGVLFQLGILYYQDNRPDDARNILEKAIALNPDYANARYFLGLIYDQGGRTEDAISQFEKILTLNPGHAEVLKILNNLKNGKPALFDLESPTKRESAPLE